jgi:DNA-binding winged helix-turn-helix (wHTH) protein
VNESDEKHTYEFGPFRLDPGERSLLREGQPVSITPKAFDLLVYLVEHHGRLVEKQKLLAAVWPDAVVEEGNLAYNISRLRKVLEDGRNSESLVQTVPTKGYRFVATITVSAEESSARWRRRRLAGAALLVLAGVIATAVWV